MGLYSWREEEIFYLVNHIENGIDVETISWRLQKTKKAICRKVDRLKESGEYAYYIAKDKEYA